jgi:hypothetical protein
MSSPSRARRAGRHRSPPGGFGGGQGRHPGGLVRRLGIQMGGQVRRLGIQTGGQVSGVSFECPPSRGRDGQVQIGLADHRW